MRTNLLFATVAMLAITNAAFAANGLNKHDASIANYGYTIPIITGDSPGSGNLKVDLDSGNVSVPSAADMAQPTAPRQSVSQAPAVPQNIQPIAVGTQAPDFALPSQMGGQVSLQQVTAHGPALVLFTNGIRYSSQYLQLLQKNLRQFQTLGMSTIAITPDVPNALQAAGAYGFPILSDTSNGVAQAYGVSAGYAPIPALFTIDAAGKVAAVQLQQQPHSMFDLKMATDPVRGQVQPAITTPMPTGAQLPTAPQMMAPPTLDAPIGHISDDDMVPGAAPNAVIPAVPSPQSNKGVPSADVPKISYEVPPSNPNFNADKLKREAALVI